MDGWNFISQIKWLYAWQGDGETGLKQLLEKNVGDLKSILKW